MKTTKDLEEMRRKLDVEAIRQRTIEGQLERIRKKKETDAEERVRVPDSVLSAKLTANEGAAKTRS